MISPKGKAQPVASAHPPSFDRTLQNVAHILRRAGFGSTFDETLAAARDGLKATVNRLVDYDATGETFSPPDQAYLDMKTGRMDLVAAWWLERMITTQRPLQEKMTLFWHGHFATAVNKVRYPGMMYNQNQLFRDHALDTFDAILGAVYKDPAMLIWLDGERNTKFAPNENFGREVMEVFTLGRTMAGRPNYSEDDVHAMARAFTGWQLDRVTGQAIFNPRLHDSGVKTILGKTGAWTADDAVDILVNHPATGQFLATKLWNFFASDTPPQPAVDALAKVYYASGHSIREVVRALFSLPEFYSVDARRNHVKSPTEFIVTPIRQLGLQAVDTTLFPRWAALLGQELFNPPNVGGWAGGAAWINAATMLNRFNFASRLTGNAPGSVSQIDGAALVTASGADNTDQLIAYLMLVLGIEPSSTTHAALRTYVGQGPIDDIDSVTKSLGAIHLALVSPEYQVA